ncbi:MAG: hypothetical protein IT436_13310 [Phycisphaerales bacterium]|nr:hypothetical protein [Phycisphaerales bacterium]
MAIAAVAAHGQTVTVFQSGFEPGEGYSTGALAGQNGWFLYQGEDPDFGRVTNANPLSGSQSILLRGQDVEIGSFGNYAGLGRSAPITPSMNGNPLRFIEITGLCAIDDPTPRPGHLSIGGIGLYRGDIDLVTDARATNDDGRLIFGYDQRHSLPVRAGTPFEFRHVMDYQTGLVIGWLNGQLAYQDFPAFSTSVPDSIWLELSSQVDLLPFDTQVWFDDLHITATYVPSPGVSLLALVGGVACVRRRRHDGLS